MGMGIAPLIITTNCYTQADAPGMPRGCFAQQAGAQEACSMTQIILAMVRAG
jgi:hypothetical protein